jgi:hypothetical protein
LTIKFTLNTEYLDKKSGDRNQESESTPNPRILNISQCAINRRTLDKCDDLATL